MNIRTNTITPATLVPRKYDTVGEAYDAANGYIEFAAPDYKTRCKSLDAVDEAATSRFLDAPGNTEALLDMLYALGGAFEEMADRAHYKAKEQDTPKYVKYTKRATFYRQIADWAGASFTRIDGHQSSPTKDAEDDSDPYSKMNVTATPSAPLTNTDDLWQKIASTLKVRYDNNLIARAKIEFDRAIGTVWGASGVGDDHCRILEQFGDTCANIDYNAPTDEKFWDACVWVSDDLRATIAAENIKTRSTYAQPVPPPPMPLVTTRSEEFIAGGVMWEVAGDVSRSLCHTKTDAKAWARALFPSERVDKLYARIQSRTTVAQK